jgi:hypothetical protein
MIFESLCAFVLEKCSQHCDTLVEFFPVAGHRCYRLDFVLQVVCETMANPPKFGLSPRLHEVITQFRE